MIPARAVLVCEQHELSGDEPRIAPRVMQEHQREQAAHLGLVGHQLGEHAPEADRVRGQVQTAAVALVEDQVDDGEHRRETFGQQVPGRNAEWDPGDLDLRLRARQAALHRLGRDDERPRDLLGAQATERAQRERYLGVDVERRMTAGEQQLEPFIGDHRVFGLVHNALLGDEQRRLGGEAALATDAIDRAVAPGADEPGDRVGRLAVARPPFGRDRKRLLGGLLGEIEVTEEADQRGEDSSPLVAEDALDQGRGSTIGRTSTEPPRRTAGMRSATLSAASTSATSNR